MATPSISSHFPVPNFPCLVGDAGILFPFLSGYRNTLDTYINNFSDIIGGQPSFFITRDSWDSLFEGKNSNGVWLPKGFEVYGFAFCIAIQDEMQFEAGHNKAYFRVRTIIKAINENCLKNEIKVEVEQDCIAYVDLISALNGIPDNLIFLDGSNRLKYLIDSEVSDWKNDQINLNSIVKIRKDNKIIPITQEGSIFSKDRIKAILDIYPTKGSKIFIALNTDIISDPKISFVLDINDSCEVQGINCPPPVAICKTN